MNGLNKAKAKLERDLDEVRILFYIERTILIGSLYFIFSIINLSIFSKSKFTKKKRKFEERLKNKREKWKATLRYDFFYDFVLDFDVEGKKGLKSTCFSQMTRDELQEMTAKRDELENVVKKYVQ